MSFILSYNCNGKCIITKLSIDNMTRYAAVCYALLQSGAATKAEQTVWPDTYAVIVEVANQLDITNIQFQKTGEDSCR